MSLYSEIAADLAIMFAAAPFGDAVITRPGSEVFDARQRRTIKGADVTVSARAVVDTVERRAQDGTTSISTIMTLNVEPLSGDRITLGSTTWRVSDVSSEAPAGVALVHYATVTR